MTGHFSVKTKPWLITYIDHNIIIEKARRFDQQTNTISITHWTFEFDENNTSLYPLPDICCYPCTGCSLNSNRIQNLCTIDVSATLSTKFLGRKVYTQKSKLKLNANYLDLIFSISITPFSIYTPPALHINTLICYRRNIFSL